MTDETSIGPLGSTTREDAYFYQLEQEKLRKSREQMSDDLERVALFDMDGTLADYNGQLLKDLEAMKSPNEPPITIQHEGCPAWLEARMDVIKSIPGWWLKLPVLQDGLKIYYAAKKLGFHTEILTKGPRRCYGAWGEKLRWCQENIAHDLNVTVTMNKGRYYGRILVDDYIPYAEAWLKHRPRGLVIMPARNYNEGFTHPNVVRHIGTDKNWDEVVNRMGEAFNRK